MIHRFAPLRVDEATVAINVQDTRYEYHSIQRMNSSLKLFIETTAHTLCFAFALLALYPDEQEKMYEQIKTVLAGRDLPVSVQESVDFRPAER